MNGTNDTSRRSPEQQRADASAILTRAIDALHRWQRHARNPAKNPRPVVGMEAIAARILRAEQHLNEADQKETSK